jgi:hypothetical protein
MITDENAVVEVINPPVVEGEQAASPAEGEVSVATDAAVVEFTPDQIKAETAKRFEKLLTDRKAATEREHAATKRASELEARVKELENPIKKPDRFEFDDEDKYIEALTNWTIEARERAQRSESIKSMNEAKAAEDKAVYESNQARFLEKVEEASKAIPDIKKALENVYLDTDNVMLQVIHESPLGAEIAYYLAKNEKTARDIAILNPLGIARELGKLEIQIAADKTRKLNTNAPTPITPVGGKGGGAVDYSNETTAQYVKRVNEEEVAARRR